MPDGIGIFSDDELLAELSRRRSLCLWCDEPAVALCDEWIGGGVRDGFFVLDSRHETCDAPLCGSHAEQIGFVCFRSGDGDSIDRCPLHRERPVDHHPDTLPITPEAISAVRRAVTAAARRARMRSV